MMISAEDDDDFWANEDFIATIENVVKKAEEASAARHGGTQFVGTGTSRFPSISPQPINSRPADGNNNLYRASPISHEILNFRPANGSSPQPADFMPGSSRFLPGNGASPIYPTSHGQQVVNHNNTAHQAVKQEPPKDVQIQPSPVLNPNFLWRMHGPTGGGGGGGGAGAGAGIQSESDIYRDIIAEKDGAISVLRSRNKVAEQQLDELRKRMGGPQHALHPSLHQQREVERLSAQLQFKDHEISEAQRARADREESLRAALAETAALRDEVDRLKRSQAQAQAQGRAQSGVQFKRPRPPRDKDVAENNPGSNGFFPNAVHDPWAPPWKPEGPSESNAGRLGKSSKGGQDLVVAPMVQDEVEILNERTRANACEPSGENELLKGSSGATSDPHRMDVARASRNSTGMGAHEAASGVNQSIDTSLRMSEMYHSLQQILGLKGVTNDGVSLLSKLYANCREDLYMLLSDRASSLSGPQEGTERHTGDCEMISEKLHNALAKVANGFAQPEIIIAPLLEFCKLDNVNIVGSSLRVLHCILQDNGTCRLKVHLKGGQGGADHPDFSLVCLENCKQEETIAYGRGWFVKSAAKGVSTQPERPFMAFSSPRIRVHLKSGESTCQSISGEIIHRGRNVEIGVKEQPNHLVQQALPVMETHQKTSGDTAASAEEFTLLVKWLFHLAMTSSSSNVKCEALAVICVLVVNSEPFEERSMFEPFLCLGGIELFLKQSAGVETKLQAIRIVHLLLHCPKLFQRFCASSPKQLPEPNGTNMKLLESVTECLKLTSNTLQGLMLYRSVIRLLSFVAISGDSGAASLMQVGTSQADAELQHMHEDNPHLERTGGEDNARGQPLAGGVSVSGSGSGSGPIRYKGLEADSKGNSGSGLVVDSVDILAPMQSVPQRLVALVDSQLDTDAKDLDPDPVIRDERDCLIREAALFLCRLSSHRTQAPVVIGHLTGSKKMARLTLSVSDSLAARKSHPHASQIPGEKPAPPSNVELVELARGLRKRVLSCLTQSWEPL